MSQFVGMDPQRVRAIGKALKSHGNQLQQMIASIDSMSSQTLPQWRGSDAQQFRLSWESDHRTSLLRLAEAIDQLGQSALSNADDQEETSSSAETSTGVSGHHADGDVTSRRPKTSHDTKGLLRLTRDTGDDCARIQKIIGTDGKERFIVYINGTGSDGDMWDVNNRGDIFENGKAINGFGGQTEDYVREKMRAAHITSSSEVLIVGYSQGGIHAQNIALLHEFGSPLVVTKASPQAAGSMGDINILRIELRGDVVVEQFNLWAVGNDLSRMAGLDRGSGIDTKFVTDSGIQSGLERMIPGVSQRGGAAIHQYDLGYENAADQFDNSDAADHVAFRAELKAFQGGTVVKDFDHTD